MKFANVVVNFLKFMLCVVVYTVVFMIVMEFIPFSQGFTEIMGQMNESQTTASSLIALFPFLWICFTALFIIRHTK